MQNEDTTIIITKRKTTTKTTHQKHNTWQTYGKITHNNQQPNTSYVIAYKQKPTHIIQTVQTYEQVAVQIENSSNTTRKRVIRTTWLLFAYWKYKHQINNKERKWQTKLVQQKHNKIQTYGKRTNIKPQTNHLSVIRYERKKHKIQTVKHDEQVTVQNGTSNNTMGNRMIRATWLLFANWKHKHHINRKEYQRQTNVFWQKHNTRQHIRQQKQQIANNDLKRITYKQSQTTKQYPTYKHSKTTDKQLCKMKTHTILQKEEIRTTWLWLATCKYKHHNDKKGKQRQTKVVQQEHNTKQTNGKGNNNKKQTRTLYVRRYKSKNKSRNTNNEKRKTTNK